MSTATSRVTRAALIQARAPAPGGGGMEQIKREAIDKHVALIAQAAQQGAKVCCLQELFYSPYFCAEQRSEWLSLAEDASGGPTVKLMRDIARRHGMVLIVPIVELETPAHYYNTAVVIGHDGALLGRYRKHHLPHCEPGFWEKFYFRPGNGGYPVFATPFGRIGVMICYDRHFPEAARELGLNGAEIVFNPSATVAGLSENLWTIEQPAHAVANQYFVGAINRVGVEEPWAIGEFYGQSYFCDPQGRFVAKASRDRDEVLVADLDLSIIDEARRTWAFYRDRRPETYAMSGKP